MSDCSPSVPADLVRRLRGHVEQLAGVIGERNVLHPAALRAAADYLRQVWQAAGYEVSFQAYRSRGVAAENLQVTRRGSRQPDRILLLGAHYDTVSGSPGANDNGSGLAALLELSRLFAGLEPGCTLRFVAFVNEEWPFFATADQGSMRYARAARERGDDIRLMISLETMGYYRRERGSQAYPPLFRYFYPDRGDFVAFVSNLRSRRALGALYRAFRSATSFPAERAATFGWVPGVSWSDHYSFWRHGYRAVMVTDTAFYRYPYYHSPDDTPDKLDYDALAGVTQGLCEALRTLSRRYGG